MLAKLITIVNDYSGYKLAGVVLTLLVLTSCNDYLEDYAEQSPTVAVEAAPFQWTRAQDIETRAMFVRNHGLGYSYNAVRGEYGKWEDIRCQVVDRYALEEYSKLTQSDFVKFQKSTYASDKSSFKYSLRDYVASVNMHLDKEVDLGLYQGSKRADQYFIENGVEESFYYTCNKLIILGQSQLAYAELLDRIRYDDEKQLLTPSFRASVEHVRKYFNNDIAVVDSFVNIWGTHVIVRSFLGGELNINLQNYVWRYKDTGKEHEITTDEFLGECERSEKERQEDGFTWIEHGKLIINAKGGDQSSLTNLLGKYQVDGKRTFSIDGVSKWTTSFVYDPDDDMASNVEMVDMTVVPIWTFAEAVSPVAAQYIKAAILQDVDYMQKLLGENNFYDTTFPARYDTLCCEVQTQSGEWTTVERTDSKEMPMLVNIESGGRIVAAVCHEQINNIWFWVAYPVYEGVINKLCGVAVSEATGMVYDVRWLEDIALMQAQMKGDAYVYCNNATFYMNAGKIMVEPQEGITYNESHPMPYYALSGGIQHDGTYRSTPLPVEKQGDNYIIRNDNPSLTDIVGFSYDNKLKAYRRQDKYTYIYNPNEMRTVEGKSEK